MSGYWVVERKLTSGGTVLVGLETGGIYYTTKGREMRFADRRSADAFKAWASGRVKNYVGQTGPLYVVAVGGAND